MNLVKPSASEFAFEVGHRVVREQDRRVLGAVLLVEVIAVQVADVEVVALPEAGASPSCVVGEGIHDT